jgi:hypothetical protein
VRDVLCTNGLNALQACTAIKRRIREGHATSRRGGLRVVVDDKLVALLEQAMSYGRADVAKTPDKHTHHPPRVGVLPMRSRCMTKHNWRSREPSASIEHASSVAARSVARRMTDSSTQRRRHTTVGGLGQTVVPSVVPKRGPKRAQHGPTRATEKQMPNERNPLGICVFRLVDDTGLEPVTSGM